MKQRHQHHHLYTFRCHSGRERVEVQIIAKSDAMATSEALRDLDKRDKAKGRARRPWHVELVTKFAYPAAR
jgi:hypothetical protein